MADRRTAKPRCRMQRVNRLLSLPKELRPVSLPGKVLLCCLYGTPVVAILWFVSQTSVNVPFGDQWSLVGFFERIHNGTVEFDEFLLHHGEHQMLLPRAIFASLAFATGWNIRAELYLSVLLTVITFVVLFKVSLKGFVSGAFRQPAAFHAANLLTSCFVFSWIQHQNWLWGFQIPWFFINTCLALSILVLYPSYLSTQSRRLSSKKRLGIAAIFCYLSSFSLAHGLFNWIALVPSILAHGKTPRAVVKWLSLWGLLFLICLAFYFSGYSKPEGAAIYYARSVSDFLGFFFVSLGFPLWGDTSHLFVLMLPGILVFSTFTSICLYVFTQFKTKLFWQAVPWLSLGLRACVFAVLNSYGRSGNGVIQALQSRYTTPSVLLCVAVVQLLPIVCHSLNVRISKGCIIAFSAAVLVLQINTFAFALETARYGEDGLASRLKQPACIEMVRYLEDSGFDYCFVENENATRQRINLLNRLGLRESFEALSFVEGSEASTGTYPSFYKTSINAKTSQVEIGGSVYLPSETPPEKRPTAVVLALDGQKTFVASTHLETESLPASEMTDEALPKHLSKQPSRQDRLTWRVEYSNEDFIALVTGARYFDAYLYYPQQSQFVRLKTKDVLGKFAGWSSNPFDLLESGDVFNEDERGLEKRIGPAGQPVLLAHADTKIVVPLSPASGSTPALDSQYGQQLSVGYGVLEAARQEALKKRMESRSSDSKPLPDGVVFRISALSANNKEEQLFSQWLNPYTDATDRGEKTVDIALPAGAHQVILETLAGPKEDSGWDWSYWSAFELTTTPTPAAP